MFGILSKSETSSYSSCPRHAHHTVTVRSWFHLYFYHNITLWLASILRRSTCVLLINNYKNHIADLRNMVVDNHFRDVTKMIVENQEYLCQYFLPAPAKSIDKRKYNYYEIQTKWVEQ